MAFGDGADDATLAAAWDEFCDRLKAAGAQAFKDHNATSGRQRADGFRFLTQNLGQAFDLALETADTRYPVVHPFCTPLRKLGGDCADFTYHQAWIDGTHTYRITGNRGTAPFFNITVQGARRPGPGVLHEPFGDVPEANLFGHQLTTGPDGELELHIGGPPRETNWLPTTPDSRKLFIRQGFDRWDERPAALSIERVDMDSPRPVPTAADMVAAVDWAGEFVTGLMSEWPEFPFTHGGVDAGRPNTFPRADAGDGDDKRGRAAANMYWELSSDEALIIDFPAHAGLWTLTNMGVFFTSMDYLYRPVSFTPSRTAVDTDGRIRIVLAHDDPGCPNWMDTQDFSRGNVTYRHMLAGHPVTVDTTVVARAEVIAALPPDTPTVTPQQRTAQLRERFDGIRRRHRM
ncbi:MULTISPECIES: DUF1214 domain-containing protein [Mycobacteriaceae]|uniref:DUF1214 domain-containing protein n=1 Tax=Mycobacteriaceae TaxID=1762 RepID=UPI0007FD61E1|nr:MULTISPECIES: DUF1214 domain-containing protein [Mycobacteriaceae]MCK0175002.1 DUF1214 domain-containing protein [Mycolicibacterium sp. F2034L]OBB61363.1 hypothetical protein A5757_07635 [Mycobacterium sp. 852013-51886_SCH5428379]